jgi:hypothetical protein
MPYGSITEYFFVANNFITPGIFELVFHHHGFGAYLIIKFLHVDGIG